MLLFLEDIYSLVSNSAPVCTIFVDFRAASDQLWFLDCIGKLRNMGIPPSFLNWIEVWLNNRRCFIEINGSKSCWLCIEKGGPQRSVLIPTLFITYNCDMGNSLYSCISHFFADNLAGIMAGQIGIKYSSQCLDSEKRIKMFLDSLEYYFCLTDQPINFNKTEAMFSSRAIGHPNFNIHLRHNTKELIKWISEYKYLSYLIPSKLGWGKFLKYMMTKIKQRISLIKSFKVFGSSTPSLRKTLFLSFVLPLFTWIYPIYLLLTLKQQYDLSHGYYSSLRRVLYCSNWNENFFAFALDEKSLEDRRYFYWEKYLLALADSLDGVLLFEKANLNLFRQIWIEKRLSIKCMRTSKRFIPYHSFIEKIVSWMASMPFYSSIPVYASEEIETLRIFPETFASIY